MLYSRFPLFILHVAVYICQSYSLNLSCPPLPLLSTCPLNSDFWPTLLALDYFSKYWTQAKSQDNHGILIPSFSKGLESQLPIIQFPNKGFFFFFPFNFSSFIVVCGEKASLVPVIQSWLEAKFVMLVLIVFEALWEYCLWIWSIQTTGHDLWIF